MVLFSNYEDRLLSSYTCATACFCMKGEIPKRGGSRGKERGGHGEGGCSGDDVSEGNEHAAFCGCTKAGFIRRLTLDLQGP